MHSKVITITLLFTFNTSLSKTDTVRTDSSFYYMTDDCLTDTVFQKLKELVKLAANICFWMNWSCLCFSSQGFWYFAEKKAKFLGIFRGKFDKKSADFPGFSRGKKLKFAKKKADFMGFSREKNQNSQKNRPILREFSGKKSNFEGFSGANSRKNQLISREISGVNFAKKQSIKNSQFLFSGKFR